MFAMESENVVARAALLENEDEIAEYPDETQNIQDDRRRVGEFTYEEAISSIGFGKFHYILLALCGWALSSDAIEVLALSFILPPATCDLKMSNSDKGILNSCVFLGMMIGGYIWGSLADIYGRRYVLLWSLTVNSLFGLCSSLSQSFSLFVVLRFISGVGVGGSLPVIFAYYTEFQSKDKRGSMISLLATFWMCGNIIAAGIAWAVIPQGIGIESEGFVFNSWRIYLALCTLPSISSAMFFVLMPESPKFLMTAHSSRKAILVMRRMFRSNNPHANVDTDFPIQQLRSETKAGEGSVDIIYAGGRSVCLVETKAALIKFANSTRELFKPPHRSTSLVMVVIYFTLCFGYYGMFLWFPELFNRMEKYGGSPCSVGKETGPDTNTSSANTSSCTYDTSNKIYYESFLTAAANLPGNIITILFIDRIGRKIMLAGSMVVSGCSVFFIALLHNTTQSLIMSCVFSAITTMGFNSLDVLQMELYPTRLRTTASGVFMSMGRIASILGNLAFGELVDVYCLVPMILVASLLTIGGLLSLKLPNTIRADLK